MKTTLIRQAAWLALVVGALAAGAGSAAAGDPAGTGTGSLDLQLEYGVTLALSGRIGAADSVFISVLSASPGDPRALNNLGNLSLMRGDQDLALAFYGRASRADTADAGILLNRSVALLLGGDYDGAQAEARRAMERAGGTGPAQSLLGLRGGTRAPKSGKAAAQPALTREELTALLAAAADSVPVDSVGAADTLKTPSTERAARGRPPTWRSAGPRAAERTDIATMLYWKR